MKKIINIAFSQFEMILCDKRVLSIILLFFFMQQSITSGLCKEAAAYGERLNCLEPFIAITGSMWLQIVIPVIYLLIMYDYPTRYGGRIFYLIRTGRYEWYYSQVIFSLFTAVIYSLLVIGISVVLCWGYVEFRNEWSNVIVDIGTNQFGEIGEYSKYIRPSSFYQGGIYLVFVYDFVLLVSNLLLMNMIQLCLFTINIRKPALFICLAIELIGAVVAFVTENVRWIFPSANTIFSLHFENYISAPKYPVYFSIVYFVIMIMLLFVFGFFGISKSRLADKTEG